MRTSYSACIHVLDAVGQSAMTRLASSGARAPRGGHEGDEFSDASPNGREQSRRRLQFGICGNSSSLTECFRLAHCFALCGAPVLLSGETGVGKELFARAIHYMSARSDRAFVPVNCGAIPESLFEAEFFGASKGAYTGAHADREGLVEIANGGTLFLDEVDNLAPRMQVALLRFLQQGEYRRVGAPGLRKADIRLIAASNANIEKHVEERRFRLDLLFRLDVCRLRIPPLCERREDIGALVIHFLERFAVQYRRSVPTVTPEALGWLMGREWPGNLRELENVMHRVIAAVPKDVVDLPLLLRVWPNAKRAIASLGETDVLCEGPLIAARKRAAFAFEDRYLHQLMAAVAGNVSEAARRAGTERRAMGRLLQRHGIDRPRG